jgi:hypothetical protein
VALRPTTTKATLTKSTKTTGQTTTWTYTDTAVVTDPSGAGTPTGSVIFYLCSGSTTGCTQASPNQTQVALNATGAASVSMNTGKNGGLASGTQYCWAAYYQGDSTTYAGSNDSGTQQCFTAGQ